MVRWEDKASRLWVQAYLNDNNTVSYLLLERGVLLDRVVAKYTNVTTHYGGTRENVFMYFNTDVYVVDFVHDMYDVDMHQNLQEFIDNESDDNRILPGTFSLRFHL